MDETAATLQDTGLPDDFHRAAGARKGYRRMSDDKDAPAAPSSDDVAGTLRRRADA